MVTAAPSAANARTREAPIPLEAPVIATWVDKEASVCMA